MIEMLVADHNGIGLEQARVTEQGRVVGERKPRCLKCSLGPEPRVHQDRASLDVDPQSGMSQPGHSHDPDNLVYGRPLGIPPLDERETDSVTSPKRVGRLYPIASPVLRSEPALVPESPSSGHLADGRRGRVGY